MITLNEVYTGEEVEDRRKAEMWNGIICDEQKGMCAL